MKKTAEAERIRLSVYFDDHKVKLKIAPPRYRRILRGGADRVRGDRLGLEEEGPQTTWWNFGGGPHGYLMVEYGTGGAQAFVGCLADAAIEVVKVKIRDSRSKAASKKKIAT